jgi:hypothetical protein
MFAASAPTRTAQHVAAVEKKIQQIAELISTLTTERIKKLQAKKETLCETNQRLPKAEETELRRGLALRSIGMTDTVS